VRRAVKVHGDSQLCPNGLRLEIKGRGIGRRGALREIEIAVQAIG